MASKALKGLTIKIGGDTSELLDSLKDVEKKGSDLSKELGEINKLLKLDPNNTQLLAQKQKVLAESVSTTKEKLDKLKEAEKQVQEQFERGEVSEEQVRALQREIVKTEKKLDGYEKAVKETADQVDKLGDEADDTAEELEDVGEAAEDSGDGFTVAKGAAADLISNGLSALAGAAKDAISSVLELSESTREYRNEMAKLDTAFQTAGLSADAANKTYRDLYGILGDEGAAVEAAQQLAKISKTEQDLEKNTRILTGVMAEYGNSIPTEGLAEGMAASAAMGSVQGVLADALEWQGINLDDFNEKLGSLSSEEERATLIQEELTKLYGESADAYLENNSAVIKANKAQADLTAQQAELGETVEPLTQKFAEMKTQALQWLIETGLPALQNGFTWIKNNIPTLVSAVGALTTAWLAFGGAQKLIDTWNKVVAISQAALNAVMNANPIGIIITLLAALVAAFIYLWQNCESFREFWIGLWEAIKAAAQAVSDWFVQVWTEITAWFSQVWADVSAWFMQVWTDVATFFTNLWNGIVEAYHTVVDPWIEIVKKLSVIIYDEVIKPIADFFVGLWDGIVGGATAAWDLVSGVFSVVATWFDTNVIQPVAGFFTDVWDGLKKGAEKAWEGVKETFSSVATFFSGIFSTAWQGIVKVFSPLGSVFTEIKDGIVSVFKTVVNGLIKGINEVVKLPFEGLNKILKKIHDIEILEVKPFKWLTWRAPIPKIPELAQGGVLEKGQVGLLEGDGAEAVVPLEHNKKWLSKVAEQLAGLLRDEAGGLGVERSLQTRANALSPAVVALEGLPSKLDRILEAIEAGQILTIDGNALVGATSNRMDSALGRRRALAARGAI